MKATILLGTLKKSGFSNTATLCEFLATRMQRSGIACDIVKLVDHEVLAGTYTRMGDDDEWPALLQRMLDAEIIIFATPIWWDKSFVPDPASCRTPG